MIAKRSFTRAELAQAYPEIYAEIERVLSIRGVRKSFRGFYSNYNAKPYNPNQNGKPRTVTLGSCLDFLWQNGYEIEINMYPPLGGVKLQALKGTQESLRDR